MATTSAPYKGFLVGLPQGQFVLTSGLIQVALAGIGYVPDMVADVYLSDVEDVLTAAPAKTLSGVTITYDEDTFTAVAHANALTWQVATFTARWAVIYQWTGLATSSRLLGYIDFGTAREYDAEDFTLTFADGFAHFPAS